MFCEDVQINLVANTDNTFDESDNYKGLVQSISDAQKKQIDSKRFKYNKYRHKNVSGKHSGYLNQLNLEIIYIVSSKRLPLIGTITGIKRLIYAHITGLLIVVKLT